ncbi:MAG: pirin family protein [Myxococcota bacterium]
MTERTVVQTVTAHRQTEGGGFVVRRPLPTAGLADLDPILLVDEMGPVEYGPGEAVGAPDHPHRGFETVTYILEGEGAHADSAGHHGTIGPGDVQWMTAGAGVVHREMPSEQVLRDGGRVHGFQIWVNLPRAKKLVPPAYQEVPAAAIPEVTTADGRARVRIIAGEALRARANIGTHTPILFHHWMLDAEAQVELPVPEDHNLAAYVFEGSVKVAEDVVREGQLAVLDRGEMVRLSADRWAQLLLLGGRPLGEPVARMGPFVMNTPAELGQAFEDFQAGRMGQIAAKIERPTGG